MCRIQQELSSKVKEKKEPAEREAREGHGGGPAEAPACGAEETRSASVASSPGASDTEQSCHCGNESVGKPWVDVGCTELLRLG